MPRAFATELHAKAFGEEIEQASSKGRDHRGMRGTTWRLPAAGALRFRDIHAEAGLRGAAGCLREAEKGFADDIPQR